MESTIIGTVNESVNGAADCLALHQTGIIGPTVSNVVDAIGFVSYGACIGERKSGQLFSDLCEHGCEVPDPTHKHTAVLAGVTLNAFFSAVITFVQFHFLQREEDR